MPDLPFPVHIPPGAGGIPGAPHVSAIVIWVMLLVLARARYRTSQGSHEKLIIWAFVIGLGREVLLLVRPYIGVPHESEAGFLPAFPLFESWMAQASVVILIGAFLRYLSKRDDTSRLYLRVGVVAVTAAFLITCVTMDAPTGRHGLPPQPSSPSLMVGTGLLALAWGFALTIRYTGGVQRAAMLFGICGFALRDLLKAFHPVFFPMLGTRAPMSLISAATEIGVICFGYIFIQEHAADVRIAFERLEERVRQRTAKLREVNQQLLEQSTIDSLTQLYNRRYFDTELRVVQYKMSLKRRSVSSTR